MSTYPLIKLETNAFGAVYTKLGTETLFKFESIFVFKNSVNSL